MMLSDFFRSDDSTETSLSELIPIGLLRYSIHSRKIVLLNTPLARMLGYEHPGQLKNVFLKEILQIKADETLFFDFDPTSPTVMHNKDLAFRKVDGSPLRVLLTAVRAGASEDGNLDVAVQSLNHEPDWKASLARLERLMDGFLEAIGSIVEMKDPYTASHHRRTAHLAAAIAAEIGMSVAEVEGIYTAAVLHDLGKLCVPMEILSKPGSLSSNEFKFIRSHPEKGYEILEKIDFDWPVADYVLQHHERLDGSGYPGNLSGASISMESRILAVADVVEAMTSRKPYRPAHGIDTAIEHIENESGKLFDSEVVNSCRDLFRDKGYELPEQINLEPVEFS
jgi:putative nucleotidyltransferase with HDIG domain